MGQASAEDGLGDVARPRGNLEAEAHHYTRAMEHYETCGMTDWTARMRGKIRDLGRDG